jgi:glyoxylase-like metal-dependent hydrolase (beta-lactamase superfamily II)
MGTEVRHVTNEIVCLRRKSYLTCSYIVRTADGLVLIDAGMDSNAADVKVGLKALGERPEAIRAVLLTHWHNDHAAGAAAVHELVDAPVFYHSGDEPYLTGQTKRQGVRWWLNERIPELGMLVLFKGLLGEATPRSVKAHQLVIDGDRLFGDFEVVETHGHTPGHVAYFYRPARALFAGDALAIINGRVRFMARPVTPNITEARKSLRRCLSLDPAIICPGHREPLTTGVTEACNVMSRYLDSDGRWPLLG